MPKPITCRVRQFSPRHLTQLVRLEEHCQPDPFARWRWAEFRDACTLPFHRLLVALDDGGAVVAFTAFVDEAAVVRVLSQAGTAAGQRALQTELWCLAGSRVVMWPGGGL